MTSEKRTRNPLIRVLGNKRWQFISIPVFSILCSLVAISIVILLIGKNPLTAFVSLLQGSGWVPKPTYAAYKGMFTDFMETLDAMTPMLFAALAVSVAGKTGLFNIGVSGQMLAGGFLATIIIGYSNLPWWAAWPLSLLIGIASGALVGGLIGWLKHRFNINEVVSSIMLNYIIQYIISFFIQTEFVDPVSRQSRAIRPDTRLTLMNVEFAGLKTRIPVFFLLALLCAVVLFIYISKTKQGYELNAVGLNTHAAQYAGIRVGRTIISGMVISGALAGLAGITYYMGYYNSIQPGVLAALGFDSIAVSLLGNSHPLGAILSSTLITTLSRGSIYMSSTVGVRQEIASLVIGMILLFSACGGYIRYKVNRGERPFKKNQKTTKGGQQA